MKNLTLFSASMLVAIFAGMAPQAFAQTYVPMHGRAIVLAGSNGTDVTNTLTIQAASLSGSSTITLPGGNTAGVLLNDGTGHLTWTTVSSIVSGLYLPTAGGTMSGGLNMGGNDITNAGSITATTFNGNLNGNAATATSSTSFTGSLAGDVTGTQGATTIDGTSSTAGGHIISALTSNGGTLTNNTSGNAATATTATNFSGSLAGDVTGTQGATAIDGTSSTAGGHIISALTSNGGTLTNNTSGNAATATTATSATNATNAANIGTVATSTAGNYYPVFVGLSTGGNQVPDINSSLSYDPSTGTLSATSFSGSFSGNATTATTATNFSGSLAGDVTGTQGATAIDGTSSTAGGHIIAALTTNGGTLTNNTSGNAATASLATMVELTQEAGNANFYPTFVPSNTTGAKNVFVGTGLSFNPSTNNLTTTTFTGALNGNATTATTATSFSGSLAGDVTGTQGATQINTTSAAGGHIITALTNNAGTLTNNTSGTAAGFTGSLNGDVTGTQGSTSVVKLLGNTIPSNAAGVLTNNGTGTLTWSSTAGALTSISVASANGLAGSSSGGTTPSLTLSTTVNGMVKGNGTALSAATSGTDYSAGTASLGTGILKSTTGTGALSIAVAGDFPTLNQNTTGTASNVTGIVSLAHGGTGQDNTTGVGSTAVFAGNGSGGATFRTLTTADLPSLGGTYIVNGTSHQTSPSNFNIDTGTALVFSGADGAAGSALTVRGGNGSSTTAGALTLEAGGATSGSGAGVSILGRNAHTSGTGGNVTVTAGNAAGTNQAGGNIALMPGTATGTGTRGGVGINTSSPNVDLDINGDYATRSTTCDSTSSTLNNIYTAGTSNLVITSETSAFTITGFANGYEGKRLRIYNKTGKNMTIANENTGSSAGNRINTLSGGDITLVGNGSVEFVYDDNGTNEWVAASTLATQVTGIIGTPQNLLRASNKNYTSATLVNDTDFSWATGANQTWEVDGVLDIIGGSSNTNLGLAINAPGTPSAISIAVSGMKVGSASGSGIIGVSLLTSNATEMSNPMGCGSTQSIVYVHGVFTTDTSTSGTTYLQFNLHSGTGPATVQADSYIRVTRIQ